MLVYSMTPEEKVMELKRDYWELMIQIKAWGDAFCKEARKMKNIHWITAFMEKHKVCKTHNGNEWHIYYRCRHGYCVYNCIIPMNGPRLYLLTYLAKPVHPVIREYTPHFMKRYSERFLRPKGINLSGIEALAYFESRTTNMINYLDDDDKTMYSVSDDGFVVSENLNGLELMKTFIARDEDLSKNKAYFTSQVVQMMMFYRFLIINQKDLTFPKVFEELKKVNLVDEKLLKAFETDFGKCQRLNYEDVIEYIRTR